MREHKGHNDSARFDACTIITRITRSNQSEPTTTLGEGIKYLTLRVQFYANECNSTLMSATGEETLTPNPNEWN